MFRVSVLSTMLCGAVALSPQLASQDCALSAANPLPAESLSNDDWSSIRAVYEADRHAAIAVEGGHRARNPGQQWTTHFDGAGFMVRPDRGSWEWGLQLQSYGFVGLERAMSSPASVSAIGQRVAYDWDSSLTEWYVNDTRGLEHGFTVRERPPQEHAGPLTFQLAVRGELRPEVQAEGHGVRFVNGDGATVLTYAGLSVFDANGHVLDARWRPLADELLLTIDDRGARYPLTIDPVAQQAYLSSLNTTLFGYSVSISGDTVVVGDNGEGSSTTGVNGPQTGIGANSSGAAYVFVRSGTTWTQQAYLKASNTGKDDFFGVSVSVSGNTVVVGARFEDSGATGVNGFQGDNGTLESGAAYVFVRNGTTWSQQAYLKASNTNVSDWFGTSVSVSGDTVVVGAYGEASNSTGINGDEGDDSANDAGAVYVFVRNGATWSQQAYLKASNTGANDFFGYEASISGNTLVVGAFGEASNATGVNGDQSNNSAPSSGAAYVFIRSGNAWSQQAYVKASNTGTNDQFGYSVSVSDDTLVVGARLEDSNATGVNGVQTNNSAADSGAAYVLVRSGSTWSQLAYLKASNTGAFDQFGWLVDVSGTVVVAGAHQEDSNAIGVDGDGFDNSAAQSGAAYIFVKSGTSWTQLAYIKASDTTAGDLFGYSVSVSGPTVVVGAQFANAAYVFDLDLSPDPWADLGASLAGATGMPSLVGSGSLTTGSAGTLTLSNAAPSAPSLLFISLSSTPTLFKCGTLVPVPWVVTLSLATNGAGGIPLAWSSWPAGLSGLSLYFQHGIQDAAAICGASLSNALRADVP